MENGSGENKRINGMCYSKYTIIMYYMVHSILLMYECSE